MLAKGLIAILENKQEIKITLTYEVNMDSAKDNLIMSAKIIFPEYGNANRSYTSYITRIIPTEESLDATNSFEILYRALNADYIKYVISPHIVDYYKSEISSWIDISL